MEEEDNFIRTFIAIDFPEEIIREVARLQSLIQNKKFTGKLTELENLHVTLKFLGEIQQNKLDQIQQLLKQIKFRPIRTFLESTGTFSRFDNRISVPTKGDWREDRRAGEKSQRRGKTPSIVWLNLGGSDILKLQKQIDDLLIKESLAPPEHRFIPHLTIARIKYIKDKSDFTNYIKNLPLKKIHFTIDNFKLKSSTLKPMGPVYTTIEEYK